MSEFVCFFFAGGRYVLNWGLVLKLEIVLNVCTIALQDTQENQDYANWNGAPPLPREPGKGEALQNPRPVPPEPPLHTPSLTTHCVYVRMCLGSKGNVNFLFIWEIVHGKQIFFSLIHLLIVYNICISMQNT